MTMFRCFNLVKCITMSPCKVHGILLQKVIKSDECPPLCVLHFGKENNLISIKMSELKDINKYDLTVFPGYIDSMFLNTGGMYMFLQIQ